MSRNHVCRICEIRSATLKFSRVHMCTKCNNKLLDDVRAAGPPPARLPLRKEHRRVRLPNDLLEMADRYAAAIRMETGEMIDGRGVIRDCVENAFRRAMNNGGEQKPESEPQADQ